LSQTQIDTQFLETNKKSIEIVEFLDTLKRYVKESPEQGMVLGSYKRKNNGYRKKHPNFSLWIPRSKKAIGYEKMYVSILTKEHLRFNNLMMEEKVYF
jgi:hypothetical protein